MKKNLALVLAILLLALPLFSCSNTTNKEEDEQAPVTTADLSAVAEPEETEDPNARIDSGLAPADYGGYTFNIFIHNTITNDFEAEEITGEPVNDAEYERMVAVQDKANCEIVPLVVAADNRQGQKAVGTSVQAGTRKSSTAFRSI